MSDISRPFVTDDDPDRHIRCQDALQFAFRDLITAAIAAGWHEREAIAAIGELADNRMAALAANDETAILLDLLKKMS
jgi:hypothetical protein